MSLIKIKEKILEHDNILEALVERCLNEDNPVNPNEWGKLDDIKLEIKELVNKL